MFSHLLSPSARDADHPLRTASPGPVHEPNPLARSDRLAIGLALMAIAASWVWVIVFIASRWAGR